MVSALFPKSLEAVRLKIGDLVPEDTSILTQKKSFVRIQLNNKSYFNVGPDTKIVLKTIPEKDPGLMSLLKGQVRANLKKDKKNKKEEYNHHFLIRTKNAAIGVRGTELHSIYNPENNVTSLITYKGEVKMVKLDKDPIVKRVDLETLRYDPEINEIKKLDEKLVNEKESVEVKSGQISSALPKEVKTSEPVKMNPVQLTVLYRNEDLRIKEEVKKVENIEIKKEELLVQAKQEAPIEGFKNTNTGEFAPRAGGFVDLSTGLYIEPEKESRLNDQKNVFVPQKIGNFDASTGQYLPPEGLELDAVMGFVVKKDYEEKLDKDKLAQVEKNKDELNESLIVIASSEEKTEKDWVYSQKDLQALDQFNLAFSPHSVQFKTRGHQGQDPAYVLESDHSESLDLNWVLSNATPWFMTAGLGIRFIRFNSYSDISDNGPRRYYRLRLGLLTSINETWSLHPEFMVEQRPYLLTVNSASPSDRKIVSVSIPSISVGLLGRHRLSNRWRVRSEFRPSFNFPKSFITMRSEPSLAFFLSGELQFWWTTKDHVSFGPFLYTERSSVEGSDYKYTRNDGGLTLRYGVYF